MLQHIGDKYLNQVLKECYRILEPDGKFIFSVYTANRILYKEKTGYFGQKIYFKRYNMMDIEKLFQETNFKSYKVYGFLNFPFYYKFKDKNSILGNIIYQLDKFFSKIFLSRIFSAYYLVIFSK